MKTKVLFIISFLTSIILCIAGFIVPPTGIIDGSVLTAVGLLLGFGVLAQLPTLIKEIETVKIKKGDLSAEITTDHEDESK